MSDDHDETLYCHAEVGRTGLGNMLLPWARCEAFRQQWGAAMLAPRWTWPKIGPLLRRERDKRYYLGLFNKRTYVRGLSRMRVLLTARRVPEEQFAAAEAADAMAEGQRGGSGGGGKETLVVFAGLGRMFEPLLPHRDLLRRRLMEMLSGRTRRRLAAVQRRDFVIGAHVRRGDKPELRYGRPQTDPNQAMPEQWFVRTIQNLRKVLGFAAPVRVFTDARPGELRHLLSMPNVVPAPPNPSIVDILALSRSRVMIGSAHSTFSLWAAFLGEMPSLWYPGGAVGLSPDKPQLEADTDLEGNLAPVFGGVIEGLNLALNP